MMTQPDQIQLPDRLLPMVWLFTRRQGWKMALLALFPLASTLLVASYSNATRHITNAVLTAEQTHADLAQAVTGPLIFFIALVIGTFLIRCGQWVTAYHVRQPFVADIRRTIFSYVQRHDASYFEANLSGKIAHKAAMLPDLLRSITERCMYDLSPGIAFFTISMFYFASVRPQMAGLVACWLAIYYGTILWLGRGAAQASSYHNEAKTQLTGKVVDMITNIRAVIANAAHRQEDRVIGSAVEETRKRHAASYIAIVKMRVAQQILNLLMWIALYSFASYEWINHRINAGDFVLVTALGALLINRAQDLGDMMPDFIDDVGSAMESIETLVVRRALTDAPGALPLQVAGGEIRLAHLRFAYPGGATVFDDLNLVIRPGQRVGLVGASGAGKSTLVTLLLRLQDVTGGGILIDGQDIKQVTQDSLRRQIGLIPQETILFYRSLKENIRYGRPGATDEEVIAASKAAYADEFIRQLPQGYDTLVGERGVKLSGGQRQRVAIARALLKAAPILILDEATSALDSESEALIQDAMQAAMQRRTVIAIAHRLSTIAHLDRLIVLEQGRIVEDGTHAALLARDGTYAKLWHRQSGGFLVESSQTLARDPDEGDDRQLAAFAASFKRDADGETPAAQENLA